MYFVQRSHGSIEAGPTRGLGRSLGLIRTRSNPLEGEYATHLLRHWEKSKATTSMGAMSRRSREPSLVPDYIQITATAECYNDNLGTKRWRRKRGVPGVRKSFMVVQRILTRSSSAVVPHYGKSKKRCGEKILSRSPIVVRGTR